MYCIFKCNIHTSETGSVKYLQMVSFLVLKEYLFLSSTHGIYKFRTYKLIKEVKKTIKVNF